jgi:hypothetical protein
LQAKLDSLETENTELKAKLTTSQTENMDLRTKVDALSLETDAILNSTCWKITKPLRVIMNRIRGCFGT